MLAELFFSHINEYVDFIKAKRNYLLNAESENDYIYIYIKLSKAIENIVHRVGLDWILDISSLFNRDP